VRNTKNYSKTPNPQQKLKNSKYKRIKPPRKVIKINKNKNSNNNFENNDKFSDNNNIVNNNDKKDYNTE